MPRWGDPDDEDWDDDEEGDDSDDDGIVPCPHCGGDIHEESQRCPHCDRYISIEDAPPARKPLWFALGFIACMLVIFRWIF